MLPLCGGACGGHVSLCDLELGLILAQLAPKTLFFALTARELRTEQDDFLLMLIQSSSEPVNLSGPVLLEAGQLATESLRGACILIAPHVLRTQRRQLVRLRREICRKSLVLAVRRLKLT